MNAKRSRIAVLGALLTGAALAGGAGVMALNATPSRATANLLNETGAVVGTATFEAVTGGTRVTVQAFGLTPGMHGMHVHDRGACVPGIDPEKNIVVPFGGAGGHLDPHSTHNHDDPTAPNTVGHTGDLPMLQAGTDGRANAAFTSSKIMLVGEDTILERSLVVHANADDYATDPSGKSGARVLCGRILASDVSARTYALPGTETYPEGVVVRGNVVLSGSARDGTIYAVNAESGAVSVFSPGGAMGRQSALGLKLHENHLYVAGGATGMVSVLDARDGTPVTTLKSPPSPQAFINDLAVTRDGAAYVTDSKRPVIFRVRPDLKVMEAWLDLQRTPIRYAPGVNLNGIVVTADSRALLAVQTNTGQLWRIDLASKAVREVKLDGGPLVGGDGLLLRGNTLYVAQNRMNAVTRVDLAADGLSGRVVGMNGVTGLRYPSTLAALGDDVVIVNSQLDKMSGGVPETPFTLTRTKLF
ncbi:superoxide dismutase family protein [Deinococcus maricopensis]|uniref:Superoxide dismutase copper/zinc binding protein n=1 Tax=Deinococcus maricopensis (strain DSM 21211 / LMG 22137 / NRRL B-23946 / LB-34) TaxID=709986 RepID=E8UAL5_DEIML|nr:superoxide dismutase family protein [Deinococcus maricopensis]ADV68104.1 superoxide dismutase copper/zinc binding protein [Deinococcus maricopensis DSM 21211]